MATAIARYDFPDKSRVIFQVHAEEMLGESVAEVTERAVEGFLAIWAGLTADEVEHETGLND